MERLDGRAQLGVLHGLYTVSARAEAEQHSSDSSQAYRSRKDSGRSEGGILSSGRANTKPAFDYSEHARATKQLLTTAGGPRKSKASSAGMRTDDSLKDGVAGPAEEDVADRIGPLKAAVKEVIAKMGRMDMSQLSRSAYLPENLAAMQHNDKLRDSLKVDHDASAFHYRLSDVGGEAKDPRTDRQVDLVPVSFPVLVTPNILPQFFHSDTFMLSF